MGGEWGGKGSKSKCKNNVQARAHVITWQGEAFANQSINHGPGSSQGRRRSPSPSGFISTFISAKSMERVLLSLGDVEELAKILPKRSCTRIRLPRGTQQHVGVLGPL